MTRPDPGRRLELERAALAAYCPVHSAPAGTLCILRDGQGHDVTTGICSARLASVEHEVRR